jgi:uncharacterized spore protein YtfJ
VGADSLEHLMREFGDKANAKTVFGESRQVGDLTIVPIAQVSFAGGTAPGARPTVPGVVPPAVPGEATGEPSIVPEEPSASGPTGGWMRVRPLAVLEIGPGGTRLRHIHDATAITLGIFLLVAWNVFWITRTLRAIFGRR